MNAMSSRPVWKLLAALVVGCAVGVAFAKLPPPSEEAKAKAAEAAKKAGEAAKKEAEALAKAMDRVAERYKKEKGVKAAAPTPAPKK